MQVLKEEIYQLVMQTAQSMFIENGYEATSLNAIAKQAGVSKSNLYNYFESKEAIFEKLVKPAVTDIQTVTAFFQSTVFDDELENLKSSLNQTIPYLYKDKEALLLLLDCAKGTKYETIFEDVVNILSEKLKTKVFCDCQLSLIADVISHNLIHGFIQILRVGKSESEIRQNIYFFVEYHVSGSRPLKKNKK